MIYIRDGTHVYLLLMLLACVGEYPMQSVYLLGNNRVWKRRIKELQEIQDFCLPDGGKLVRFQKRDRNALAKSVHQTKKARKISFQTDL